jgi:hypothetical protein
MATAAIIAECPTTFSLQSQSSFGHCEECGRPVVYVAKRKSSHSCESATPPQQTASRRSSAVAGWLPAALVEFLFGDKVRVVWCGLQAALFLSFSLPLLVAVRV